ncbi:hypothetical protein EMCRGX_G020305 [Ephydatia muelleri]
MPKFMLLVLGLNEADANYPCPFCTVHKDERWDTSKPEVLYTATKARTIASLRHCCTRGRTARDGSKQYLDGLITAIRICGVTFHTWKEQGREQLKWTSLTGDGRKKVMETLPSKLIEVLPHETIQETVKLWKDFKSFATPYLLKYQFILTLYTRTQSNGLIASCQYLHAGCYKESCYTIHALYGQGVEKHNDDAKRVYFSSNKWNASMDIIEQKPGLTAYESMLP